MDPSLYVLGAEEAVFEAMFPDCADALLLPLELEAMYNEDDNIEDATNANPIAAYSPTLMFRGS